MPPSKKIFFGASALVVGVLGQFLITFLVLRDLRTAGSHPGGSFAAESVDRSLERIQEHTTIGFNALTLSFLFIVAGLVLLLIGVYQTARATERIQAGLSGERV